MIILGEPQLGKRGLYPTISQKGSASGDVRNMMNIISYCDGNISTLEIAEKLDLPFAIVDEVINKLNRNNLLEIRNID